MPTPSRTLGPLLLAAVLLLAACGEDRPALEPLPDGAVVLAFGDSLTAGVGARLTATPGGPDTYPARLADLTGLTVINAGVPGEISARGLARLPSLLARHRPDLVLICHGGNDLLRRLPRKALAANLAAMVRTCRDTGAQVVLIAVPRPRLLTSPADVYEDVAREQDVPLERDALTDILADGGLKSDLVHPNAAGYARLAEAVAALLARAGALPQEP